MMKAHVVFLLFLQIILAIYAKRHSSEENNPAPSPSRTVGINAEYEALVELGITDSTVDWKHAFGRLAERYMAKNKLIQEKDDKLRYLNVLNLIKIHLETLALQSDPICNLTKPAQDSSNPTLIQLDDIPLDDIPFRFRGRLETDFKTAYKKWYRIFTNSEDSRITELKAALSKLEENIDEQGMAKAIAVIWCNVCDHMYSLLGLTVDFIKWQNADEVANAFRHYEQNGYYVDIVHKIFEITMFKDIRPVTKT